MAANEYYFVSHWRVPCTPADAYEIIKDTASLPRWWPAAFLEAEPHYFADGSQGTRVSSKGWMPYVLHWTVRELASDPPGSLTIEVDGDFKGRGTWTLMPDGDWTDITYDWRVSVEKPGVKQLSFLLKPLFQSNHRWAMKKGEESLRLELARRRAPSEAARNAIEPPPGPMKVPVLPVVPIVGVLALFVLWRLRPRKKKSKLQQATTLFTGTAAALADKAPISAKEARKAARKAEKELRRNARRTGKDMSRRASRARGQLQEAISSAAGRGNGARAQVNRLRSGADGAIAGAEIRERVEAARERVGQAIEKAEVPERLEAVRERVGAALERAEVAERLHAARNVSRRRTRGLLRRWR